jgi:formylglycine-generating enzyme required for sulfatase activity
VHPIALMGLLCPAAFFLALADNSVAAQPPFGMVLIPEASFQLGSTVDDLVFAIEECERSLTPGSAPENCSADEFSDELGAGPEIFVPAFFIDRTEVSQAAYGRCVRAARCSPQGNDRSTLAFKGRDLPAVSLTAFDAERYCHFVGGRLPSEAEFELAARGFDRRPYPWGKAFHRRRANSGADAATVTDDSDGYELLAPVESFSSGASPQRVLNLAGNAAEWTGSDYLPHGTKPGTPAPKRSIKGGSFTEPRHRLRGNARRGLSPSSTDVSVGFRCARSKHPTHKVREP